MNYTVAQRQAIETTERSTAVVAGAGSGKTAVLVGRAARLLRSGALAPEHLCCIAFTERAAAELKTRIAEALPELPATALARAHVSTFHSLQARILREQAATIGWDPAFTTLDETQAGFLLLQTVRGLLLDRLSAKDPGTIRLVDAYRFNPVVERITDCVEQRWDTGRWKGQPDDPPADPAEAEFLTTIGKLATAAESTYTAAKRARRACDFADLELAALALLDNHPAIRTAWQKLFRALIVDEAQDLNINQERLLHWLHAPDRNVLMIVGDPKQSIYRFRGADIGAFGRLVQYIVDAGGVRIDLRENFRSRPAICAFVNAATATMEWFEPLLPQRTEPTDPAVYALPIPPATDGAANDSANRRDREAATIADWIAAQHAAGAPYAAHALLFGAKTDLHRYVDALTARGIPVFAPGGGGFLLRPEVLDCTAALRVAANLGTGKPGNTALLRCLRSPLIGCTDDACYRLIFPDLSRTDVAPRPLAEAALADAAIGPRLRAWQHAARHLQPSALLRTICDETGYEATALATDPTGQAMANIEKLFWLAEATPLPLAEWLDYLDELVRRAARIPDQPIGRAGREGVQCLTIHAAKGLEFPTVILPDLFRRPPATGGAWLASPGHGMGLKLPDPADPLAERTATARWETLARLERDAEAAETQRLLYVAMTRAEECLVIPIHAELTRDKGTWHAQLSSLVRETPELVSWAARPALSVIGGSSLPSPSETSPLPSVERDRVRGNVRTYARTHVRTAFTVSELDTYARCPMQYRLQYVDRIPGTQYGVRSTEYGVQQRLPASLLGEVVHTVLSKLTARSGGDAQAILAATFRQIGHRPSAADREHACRLVEQGRKATWGGKTARHLPEWPFVLRLGDATIHGTMDLLIATPKGFTIIDYKTDRIERPDDIMELTKEYELQLATYALAALPGTDNQQRGQSPKIETVPVSDSMCRTELHFLETGAVVTTPVTPDRLATADQHLTRIIAGIREADFGLATDARPPCARCPFHHNQTCWEDRIRKTCPTSVGHVDHPA